MDDKQCTLELYKLFVDSAHKVSQMRLESNKFFVSLLTALLGGIAALVSTGIKADRMTAVLLLAVVGWRLSKAWSNSIASYKRLNSGKFDVIHKLEEGLPHQCFAEEWAVLKEKGHKGLTAWEDEVPKAAKWLFVVVGIASLVLIVAAAIAVAFKSWTTEVVPKSRTGC